MPPNFKPLAHKLWRKTLLLARHSLQPDTRVVYDTGVRLLWEFSFELCPCLYFPLCDRDWSLFYTWNIERVTPDSASNYLTHVAFLQEVALRIPRPIWRSLPLLNRVKRGARLKFGKSRRRKQPLTFKLGVKVRAITGLDPRYVTQNDLHLTIFICILLVGICGLFRLGELLLKQRKNHDAEKVIRHGQITFFGRTDFGLAGTDTFARVWLYKSKGDTFNEGVPVYVPANIHSPLDCPVQWLLAVRRLTKNPDLGDAAPMFIMRNKQLMIKSFFIKTLKRHLKQLGFDPTKYAGHSLRIGGAVSAQRAGVPHHIIQAMGRWRSQAYLLYIKFVPERVKNLREHLQRLHKVQA